MSSLRTQKCFCIRFLGHKVMLNYNIMEKIIYILCLLDGTNFTSNVCDVHEIYTIKYSHIYIFSLTFMLFCD